jgi:hypothetical protein
VEDALDKRGPLVIEREGRGESWAPVGWLGQAMRWREKKGQLGWAVREEGKEGKG